MENINLTSLEIIHNFSGNVTKHRLKYKCKFLQNSLFDIISYFKMSTLLKKTDNSKALTDIRTKI